MDITDSYLTPEEAAELLKLHPETVRQMLREGRLPGAKFGDVWRVRRADLDAFFQPEVKQDGLD